ncbi:MAG: type III pantothenate kinase [Flavobacteriaceae bacterium]|nr:type III pantothenate kinase [Flavobacteriaceae bacterium]MDG2315245.1 type III pantothenate kinase [Flavobacteriaceae bacterium]
MNLVIDIGNTRSKLAVFENHRLVFQETADSQVLNAVRKVMDTYAIRHAIVCNVSQFQPELMTVLEAEISVFQLTWESKVPFQNAYQTPKTLGVDRMALVSGAVAQFPNQAVLVIDAGSCITYDFKTADEVYAGGAISPGIQMRYAALANQTQNLPHLKKEIPATAYGTSTSSSIHSGIVHGVYHEINGFINYYRRQSENLTVILTGGDADFLSKTIKNGIFADSNLLLKGLNTILALNLTE